MARTRPHPPAAQCREQLAYDRVFVVGGSNNTGFLSICSHCGKLSVRALDVRPSSRT